MRQHSFSIIPVLPSPHSRIAPIISLKGGGADINCSQVKHEPLIMDLTTAPEQSRITNDREVYPSQAQQKGIISLATELASKNSWQPETHLPCHYGNHPFDTIIQPQVFQTLRLATQQNPEDIIVHLSHLRAQKVTTACLRDLLTHGAMTNDAILNTFLAILCAEHDTTFLSTFIIYILRRDKSWEGVRHWFATSPSLQTTSTPLVNSTSPILIPCHVNDSHWGLKTECVSCM